MVTWIILECSGGKNPKNMLSLFEQRIKFKLKFCGL